MNFFPIIFAEVGPLILLSARAAGFFGLIKPCRSYLRGVGIGILVLATALWERSLGVAPQLPRGGELAVVLAIIRELVIGVVAALPIAFAWEVLPSAGRLCDLLRGAQLSEQISPLSGERNSALEEAFNLVSAGAALTFGVGTTLLSIFHATTGDLQKLLVYGTTPAAAVFGGQFFTVLFIFVTPLLLAILLWDLITALLARTSPRANLFFELQTVRAFLGIGLIAIMAGDPESYLRLVRGLGALRFF